MAAPTTAPTRVSIWEIDPAHSAAHFSVRDMMVSTVRGEFGKIAGTGTLSQTTSACLQHRQQRHQPGVRLCGTGLRRLPTLRIQGECHD